MDNSILVSVVIPTYSRNSTLKRAIDSVLCQTYKNFEIIVIDDNKSDSQWRKSAEKIMFEYQSNKKVRYIQNKENLGGAGARNEGIKASNGDYIAFLDDDDEYYPSKIEKQLEKFLNSTCEKLALVYCDAQWATDDGIVDYIDKKRCLGNCLYEAMYYNCIAATSQWMCYKKTLESVGGFSIVPSKQDSQLILKLLVAGFTIDYVPEVLSKYYFPQATKGSISLTDKILIGEQLYFEECKKYFDRFNKKQKSNIEFQFYKKFLEHSYVLRDKAKIKEYKQLLVKTKFLKGEAYLIILKLKRLKHKIFK